MGKATRPHGLLLCLFAIALLQVSCSRRQLSTQEFLDESYKTRKISLINISDEVRFAPGSGELLRLDTALMERFIIHLLNNKNSRIGLKVSHVYPQERYRAEGLAKSDNLKKYLIAEGISPLRIDHTTFLDRRSKYPYHSDQRKVLLLLTNLKP